MFDNYFELRQLRIDVKKLDRDNDYQKRERETADRKVREAEQRIEKLTRELAASDKAKEKFKKVVREQTGADLLVNALRELGVVPKPTPEYNSFDEQNRLLQQAAGARRHDSGLAGLGQSAFGGII